MQFAKLKKIKIKKKNQLCNKIPKWKKLLCINVLYLYTKSHTYKYLNYFKKCKIFLIILAIINWIAWTCAKDINSVFNFQAQIIFVW
jgi:hypothetical protein